MAPPPAAELVEDAIAEILLRVPPEEPAHLIRASLVCKLWRRILCDPDFVRHYRRYHRTLPLLGFFHRIHGGSKLLQRFVPATASSPFSSLAAFNCSRWLVLDCRHGRVLLQRRPNRNLLVWDPITGHREELCQPCHFTCSSAAVLCAAAGCDHSDCHGGPFQVVCVGFHHFGDWRVHACVYSSQVGAWGEHVHFDLGYPWQHANMSRAAHIRDEIYFYFAFVDPKILKYDLRGHYLSEIEINLAALGMELRCAVALMPTEEGLLGLAFARGSSLHLCSRIVNAEGFAEWVQCRVIELCSRMVNAEGFAEWIQCRVIQLHNMCAGHINAIGFAEGLNVIFVNTYAGLFIIDLKSEEARKVSEHAMNHSVLPVMSFYTPDCACSEASISRIGKLITSQPVGQYLANLKRTNLSLSACCRHGILNILFYILTFYILLAIVGQLWALYVLPRLFMIMTEE